MRREKDKEKGKDDKVSELGAVKITDARMTELYRNCCVFSANKGQS